MSKEMKKRYTEEPVADKLFTALRGLMKGINKKVAWVILEKNKKRTEQKQDD